MAKPPPETRLNYKSATPDASPQVPSPTRNADRPLTRKKSSGFAHATPRRSPDSISASPETLRPPTRRRRRPNNGVALGQDPLNHGGVLRKFIPSLNVLALKIVAVENEGMAVPRSRINNRGAFLSFSGFGFNGLDPRWFGSGLRLQNVRPESLGRRQQMIRFSVVPGPESG